MLNRKIPEVFYHTRYILQTSFFFFLIYYFLLYFVQYFYFFFVLANTDIGIYSNKDHHYSFIYKEYWQRFDLKIYHSICLHLVYKQFNFENMSQFLSRSENCKSSLNFIRNNCYLKVHILNRKQSKMNNIPIKS